MGFSLSRDLLDLVVVGAGPAGIAFGAEAVTSGIDPSGILVLEKGEEHSFSIRKLYPEGKTVTANYKGNAAVCTGVLCIPDLSKGETLSYLDRAIRDHRLSVRYREAVGAICPRDGFFVVETPMGAYHTRTCAIAIGILGRPQRPDWQIPPALNDRITYDVSFEWAGAEDVLVVGGGDSASEYAQYLAQEGHRVVLSYRGVAFRRMNDINRTSLDELERSGRAKVLRVSNVERVEPDGSRIRVEFTDDGAPPATFDRIVLALGGTTPDNFLRAVGIDFDGARPVLREGYETSIPGLYLVGDLTAGKGGGSIIAAFNSAGDAMHALLGRYAERIRLAS
jgi:thioredoxin reductase (NADPH)